VTAAPPGHAQARRDRTRSRLLDASIQVLVQQGLDGFTTPAVAARAGTSQGTVFRHFASKRDLLVATTEAAMAACRDDHAADFSNRVDAEQPATADDIIRIALETLWASCTDPRLLAITEVRARCRTDHQLRTSLTAVIGTENATSGDLVTLLLPTAFNLPVEEYVSTSRIVLNAMQGRALAGLVRPDPERDRAVLESLIELVQERYRRGSAAGAGAATDPVRGTGQG
jgi:AcrR family transcriptional regulator